MNTRRVGKLCILGFAVPYMLLAIAMILEYAKVPTIAATRVAVASMFVIGLVIGTIGVWNLERSLAAKVLIWFKCVAVMLLCFILFGLLIALLFGIEAT